MQNRRKIYLASSWRNPMQPSVVKALRREGHLVYDFRNPAPGVGGFAWSAIDKQWASWTPEAFIAHLTTSPIAAAGFAHDRDALEWCDTCVCLLPCGRSAHLEAGWAAGQGKETLFLVQQPHFEPELMYLLGDGLVTNVPDLLQALRQPRQRPATPAPDVGQPVDEVARSAELFGRVAGAARALEATPVVDDDFPEVKHRFDSATIAYADFLRGRR